MKLTADKVDEFFANMRRCTRCIMPEAFPRIHFDEEGVCKKKIHLIRGGVNLSTFKVEAVPPHKKFRILYSGAFSVAYDFNMILNAAKVLQDQASDVEFVIQGGGEIGLKIQSDISNLNLENVVFINKILQHDEFSKILNESPAVYISETESGIVITPGDFKELADKILFLKYNPDLAKEMGNKGKSYVEKNVSMQQIGMQIKSLFTIKFL
jgi:glycosyltransferase involved in cell wall biosynthesis